MIGTVVVATDGSESVRRTVACALDLAARFDATVHALSVVDESQIEALPADVREDVRASLSARAEEATADVAAAADREVRTAVVTGRPSAEIRRYAEAVDADLVATGTRGRDGEHSFLLGSVAEALVRSCPIPVLTVRQFEDG